MRNSLIVALAVAALISTSSVHAASGEPPLAGAGPAESVVPESFDEGAFWRSEDEPVAEEGHATAAPRGAGNDIVPVARWSIIAIFASGLLLSVFYLLKRRVGGFPAHPAWTAPISIERSATFPTDGTYGDSAGGDHGHGHASASHH